jgi:predicted deacylase
VSGALRLLRHLRMTPGPGPRGAPTDGGWTADERVEHPLWFDRTEVLTSPATGIWYPQVERGQAVQKGTVLGYVTDFFGARAGDVRASFAGVVLYVIGTPPTSKDEPLAMIGHMVEEP